MRKTLREEIAEYEIAYLTPLTIYVKREGRGLANQMVLTPTVFDQFRFIGKVLVAVFVRTVRMVCRKI